MTSRIRLILGLIFSLLIGCKPSQQTELSQKTGKWRGTILMQKNQMPFNFELVSKGDQFQVHLINGEEVIVIDDVRIEEDSLQLTFPIFDITIKAKLFDNELKGAYQKHYLDGYVLPFNAVHEATYRFKTMASEKSTVNYAGKWEVKFVEDDGKESVAVGIFNQKGDVVTGTFLTPIGDYRYLEGAVVDDQLLLSTFDGNHAFLFQSRFVNDSTLSGDFWSGKEWHESWTAVKNPEAKLPSALSLTYLKEGYNKIDFSFPDLTGNMITPRDDQFRGNVVLLQIFGTWCPNCKDETIFYNDWYQQNKSRGVKILGLAYEQKDDFDYAVKRVNRMKEKLGVSYDYVIAGTADKDAASKTLPMLNQILSFPTTIFLDRKGDIRRIHTGFSGPGTGKYYEKFKEEFIEFTEELIAEE